MLLVCCSVGGCMLLVCCSAYGQHDARMHRLACARQPLTPWRALRRRYSATLPAAPCLSATPRSEPLSAQRQRPPRPASGAGAWRPHRAHSLRPRAGPPAGTSWHTPPRCASA
jgi:hypothetical protein